MDVKKIKKFRKAKGYTLADLSDRTGYTPSFLSQLENGIKKPSLEALRRISSVLDVPIFELLSDDENTNSCSHETQSSFDERSYAIINKDNRKKAVMPEILTEYEFITPYSSDGADSTKVVGLCTNLKPGCWACEKQISLDYDISAYILKGEVDGYIGDKILNMAEGDSIYLYAHTPHNFLNVGEQELIMIGYASKEDVFRGN